MGKAIAYATRAIVKENKEFCAKLTEYTDLLERAVEEIENCYGREIELTHEMKDMLIEIQVYCNLIPTCDDCPLFKNGCILSPKDYEPPYNWDIDNL